MKKDLTKHLMRILHTGHHHIELTEWVMCETCGKQFQLWKAEKERLRLKYPKDFERYRKQWQPGPELLEKLERMVVELRRSRQDKLAEVGEKLLADAQSLRSK